MRKDLIPLVMLMMTASAEAGGLVTKHSASVQLTVDVARVTATRIGSSFSISRSSNIDTTDGSTAGTVSAAQLPQVFMRSVQLKRLKIPGRISIFLQSVLHTRRCSPNLSVALWW